MRRLFIIALLASFVLLGSLDASAGRKTGGKKQTARTTKTTSKKKTSRKANSKQGKKSKKRTPALEVCFFCHGKGWLVNKNVWSTDGYFYDDYFTCPTCSGLGYIRYD